MHYPDLTPYVQQLQTRLDSEPLTPFAAEQQYQSLRAFPQLKNAIWQEYSYRLRQREAGAETAAETGDAMGAADESSKLKPSKIRLH